MSPSIGSVFSSVYGSQVADAAAGRPIPPSIFEGIKDSIGFALQVAGRIGGTAGAELARVARAAFVDGFHAGLIVAGGMAAIGAIAVAIWLPARARKEDIESQHAEYSAQAASMAAAADARA